MPGVRHALIIATARYTDRELTQLRTPGQDAAELADVLADHSRGQFTVVTVLDHDVLGMRLAISDFLMARKPDDVVVVYLSCHGIRDARGRLYFAAVDSRRSRLAATAVEARWLTDQLDECAATRQVLVVDCCFSGALASGVKGDDVLLGLRTHGRGRMILTASRATEYAFEGASGKDGAPGSSVFTAGLVEGLRTGGADARRRGYITVTEAYDYAYDYVIRNGGAQTPQMFAERVEGTFVLARNPLVANGRAVSIDADPSSVQRGAAPRPASAALPTPVSTIEVGAFRTFGAGRLVALAENGDRIAVAGSAGVTEYVLGTKRSRTTRFAGSVHALGYGISEFFAVGWDARDWIVRRSDPAHAPMVLTSLRRHDVRSVALDHHATTLAVATPTTVGVLRLQDGSIRWLPNRERRAPRLVTISGDAARLAVVDGDGVVVVDAHSGTVVCVYELPDIRVIGLSPDGRTLVTADHAGRLKVWDTLHTALPVDEAFFDTSVQDLAAGKEGQEIVVGMATGETLWWNRAAGTAAVLESHPPGPAAVCLRGNRLASGGPDRDVHVWQTEVP
ncbi:caspase family protein [Asanoa sp. NPDC049573]|uniref:caspase, EACC1-associated type n=1 Tax=Asanoa sp. NPDC049573 TaxID=3155396 RepID=UPI00341D6917